MQLKVSLIINIHNSSKFIKNISNTINSLANKVEVIVIDDYSTDDSHQRILDNTKNSIYKFIGLKRKWYFNCKEYWHSKCHKKIYNFYGS